MSDLKRALRRGARAGADAAIEPPAPGKATTVPQTTGIPMVDGMACETDANAGRADCFLSKEQRTRLLIALVAAVTVSTQNFRDALQNIRIELLTTLKSSTMWTGFAELLFLGTTSGLIGLLGKGVRILQGKVATNVIEHGGGLVVGGVELPHAAAMGLMGAELPGQVKAAALTGSKGLRTQLKNAAHGETSASAEDKSTADFLTLIQGSVGPMTLAINRSATAMTDAELVTAVHAFEDQETQSLEAHTAEVRRLVEEFRASQLADLGVSRSNGADAMATKQVAQVVRKGQPTRLAFIEIYDPKFCSTIPIKSYDNRIVPCEQSQFVSFISEEMAEAAMAMQRARFGIAPIVDANQTTGMREIDADWAVSP